MARYTKEQWDEQVKIYFGSDWHVLSASYLHNDIRYIDIYCSTCETFCKIRQDCVPKGSRTCACSKAYKYNMRTVQELFDKNGDDKYTLNYVSCKLHAGKTRTMIGYTCRICEAVCEQAIDNYNVGSRACGCVATNKHTIAIIQKRADTMFGKGVKQIVDFVETKSKSAKVQLVCTSCGVSTTQFVGAVYSGQHACFCSTTSGGAMVIASWLTSSDIYFETEKTFPGCKHKHLLRFDFFLPEYNLLIEFDGEQHERPIDFFGGKKAFKLSQIRDKIKNDFVESRPDLELLRINFRDKDKISKILKERLGLNQLQITLYGV